MKKLIILLVLVLSTLLMFSLVFAQGPGDVGGGGEPANKVCENQGFVGVEFCFLTNKDIYYLNKGNPSSPPDTFIYFYASILATDAWPHGLDSFIVDSVWFSSIRHRSEMGCENSSNPTEIDYRRGPYIIRESSGIHFISFRPVLSEPGKYSRMFRVFIGDVVVVICVDFIIKIYHYTDVPEENGGDVVGDFSLGQNHPNPFNPETDITFTLAKRAQASLIVYNILGEKVKTLVNGEMNVGTHTVHWDGKDAAGNMVASGTYFYRLKTGEFTQTKKMILLR